MKAAIAYKCRPFGPIQASLCIAAEKLGFDLLPMEKSSPWAPPKGKHWDDYEVVIHFHNATPSFRTSAKVLWWMCDLRAPQQMLPTCTADMIFICNSLFVDDYEKHFGVKVHYLPQCGNDADMKPGRNLKDACIFLGIVRGPADFQTSNPLKSELLLRQIQNKGFHANRSPVIDALRKAKISVGVINRERITADQKWLYNNAPLSLSVSLPVPGYTSNRLYNILSSAGFALVNWFPGIEKLFENKEHLVWFRSPEEAVELARYYLDNDDKRNAIREAGHRLYLEKHTGLARVNFMLQAWHEGGCTS